MPVVLTYDADSNTIDPNDRTRLSLAFQRFGWEHIGGSAFRYPRIEQGSHPSEDWFNHVVPALMFFRALVEKKKVTIKRFTIEAHSSPGSGKAGADIATFAKIKMYEPTHSDTGQPLSTKTKAVLSAQRLRAWVSAAQEEIPGE